MFAQKSKVQVCLGKREVGKTNTMGNSGASSEEREFYAEQARNSWSLRGLIGPYYITYATL